MKRIIRLLLVLTAVMMLSGCMGKIRVLENYSVGEYDGGWSVLYTDEKGVEEIAPIGDRAQPLVVNKGRIYFFDGDALVSVNMEGEEPQELAGSGLQDGWIFRMDETHLYCTDDKAAMNCMRADLGQTGWEEVCLPEDLRTVDSETLLAAIEEKVGAEKNNIVVKSGLVTVDGNGKLYAMELELTYYTGKVGSMYSWGNGAVSVQMLMDGIEVTFKDHNIPMYLNDDTVDENIKLKKFLPKLQSVLDGGMAAGRGLDGCTLSYQREEDQQLPEEALWVSADGAEAKENKKARHFVLRDAEGDVLAAVLLP